MPPEISETSSRALLVPPAGGRVALRNRLWTFLLLAPLAAVLLFVGLEEESFEGDEALYAAVVLDTEASGRTLPLQVDGGDYVSKPVGGFLFLKAGFAAFGPSELGARLPMAIVAWVLVLFVGDVGARWLGGSAGLFAGLVLATSRRGLEVHGFRSGTFEPLHLLAIAAIVVIWIESRRFEAEPARSRRLWRAACATSAISAWIKYLAGPVLAASAVLAGEVALALREGRTALLAALRRTAAILACGVLAYFAYVALLGAIGARGLFDELFERDLIRRAQGELHRFRQPGAGYFVAEIASDLGFALLLLVPFALGLRRRWSDPVASAAERVVWVGIAAWAAAPLLAVTLFQSRLPWYALPSYPALALALAAGLLELPRWGVRPRLVAALAAVLVAVRLVAASETLRAPVRETPLRNLIAALEQLPEARFYVQPDVAMRATSPHGIVRPQSYVYLRLLEAKQISAWPSGTEACAVLYAEREELRARSATYGSWRRVRFSPRVERDAKDFLLLENCGGRVANRIEISRFARGPLPSLAPDSAGGGAPDVGDDAQVVVGVDGEEAEDLARSQAAEVRVSGERPRVAP